MTTDTILLTGLEVRATVGVFDWERQIEQTLRIDFEMAADAAAAAASDRIEDTLDYKAVAKHAQEFIAESRCALVETLAHRLAEELIREFGIRWLRLTLRKPGAVRGSRSVGVTIERGKRR